MFWFFSLALINFIFIVSGTHGFQWKVRHDPLAACTQCPTLCEVLFLWQESKLFPACVHSGNCPVCSQRFPWPSFIFVPLVNYIIIFYSNYKSAWHVTPSFLWKSFQSLYFSLFSSLCAFLCLSDQVFLCQASLSLTCPVTHHSCLGKEGGQGYPCNGHSLLCLFSHN